MCKNLDSSRFNISIRHINRDGNHLDTSCFAGKSKSNNRKAHRACQKYNYTKDCFFDHSEILVSIEYQKKSTRIRLK
jgi:hypothetical protein